MFVKLLIYSMVTTDGLPVDYINLINPLKL